MKNTSCKNELIFKEKTKLKKKLKENLTGYTFIAPVVIGILLFTAWPIIQSVYFSFFKDFNYLKPPSGFSLTYNYVKMFGDKEFFKSLSVTFIYSITSIPLYMVLSFALAMFLNQKVKLVGVFRVLIYLPVIIPTTVGGLLWRDIINPTTGLANAFLSLLGLNEATFLSSSKTAMATYITIGLWGLGGSMVLWLAALKNVPEELYESSKIDGAGFFVRTFKITIPMCSPIIFYNLVMNLIGSLQTFGAVFTLTGGNSGPDKSLLFFVMKIYNEAFRGWNVGYASALSLFLFAIIGLLTLIIFKTSKWVFYGEESK